MQSLYPIATDFLQNSGVIGVAERTAVSDQLFFLLFLVIPGRVET